MRKFISLALSAVLVTGALAGCSSKDAGSASSNEGDKKEPIVISVPTYKAGQNTGAKFFVPQVDRFNTKYEGKYKIELEQVPEESYKQKIEQLAQQKKLPALVEGGNSTWIEKYVIPNNIYYDLGPWLEQHPDVKNVLTDDGLEYNTRDGKVVSLPIAVSRPVGLFYNTSMYQPSKPIKDMTFDEFAKDLGDNKIALATGGNAFFTQLLLTALVANEEGGLEMLNQGFQEKILDYNTPIWINAVTKLQNIAMSNGADNIMSAAGPDAMNYFLSKKSSVIPNGPWFAAEFAPEKADKWSNGFNGEDAAADLYPGNVVVANNRLFTWWIPNTASDAEKEVALAFMEFIYSKEELEAFMLAEGGVAPKLETSDAFKEKQKEDRILNQLNSSIDDKTIFAPQIDTVMPGSLSSQEFGKLAIKLFHGSLTPEQFCQELTKKAKQSVQ